MTEGAIIQLPQWLKSPAGQYLLAWEQRHLDQAVADLFGFHALQLGLPQLDALRANRMPHRWLAVESARDDEVPSDAPKTASENPSGPPGESDQHPRVLVVPPPSLRCHFDALPFDAASLDLVILPHALELARDPHLALREVERVLVPEGRVIIVGFNPASLWGTRQKLGRLRRRLSRTSGDLFLPHAGEFVGYRRLRDWLRLLSFEVEAGRFGCYIPPLTSARWLARFAWMERAGEHWWPVFGALYYIVAVKRVRGMRLVGLIRKDARIKAVTAPAPVAVTPHARVDAAAEVDRTAGMIGR
jgi:SAM-dependent methyltransferase